MRACRQFPPPLRSRTRFTGTASEVESTIRPCPVPGGVRRMIDCPEPAHRDRPRSVSSRLPDSSLCRRRHARTARRNRPVSEDTARPCTDPARRGSESRNGAWHRAVDQARRLHGTRPWREQGAPARVLPRRGAGASRRHGAHHRRGAVQFRAPRRGRGAPARDGHPHSARRTGGRRRRTLPRFRQRAARPAARRNAALPSGQARTRRRRMRRWSVSPNRSRTRGASRT